LNQLWILEELANGTAFRIENQSGQRIVIFFRATESDLFRLALSDNKWLALVSARSHSTVKAGRGQESNEASFDHLLIVGVNVFLALDTHRDTKINEESAQQTTENTDNDGSW